MNEQTIDMLKELASATAWSDDEEFMVDDYAVGNQDYAYYGGERDGEIHLARKILTSLGIVWEE